MIRRLLRALGWLPPLTTVEQVRALFAPTSKLRHRFDGDATRHQLQTWSNQ